MANKTVSIKGLNKAALLAAFYNASRPMGMGFLQAREGDMTLEYAQKLIDGQDTGDYPGGRRETLYFDYVHGRPLKIDLKDDEMSVWGFDRDHGEGATERIVNKIRFPNLAL